MTTVSFLADPGGSTIGLKVDGRMQPNSSDGIALSVELPAGLHRFASPDGRHIFAMILQGRRSYAFKVLNDGRLTLSDDDTGAR